MHAALIESIKLQLDGQTPVAVALDTLNRSIGGKEDDENMAGYIGAADAVREAFDCVVSIVHHCGVDSTRPRGHTSLTGAADAQLAVKRDTAESVVVEVEWMKDGPEGDQIVSRLEQVEVGMDEDGEPITSCVVVPVDGIQKQPSNRKLSDRQKLALNALADCAAERGKSPQSSLACRLVYVPLPRLNGETNCFRVASPRSRAMQRKAILVGAVGQKVGISNYSMRLRRRPRRWRRGPRHDPQFASRAVSNPILALSGMAAAPARSLAALAAV